MKREMGQTPSYVHLPLTKPMPSKSYGTVQTALYPRRAILLHIAADRQAKRFSDPTPKQAASRCAGHTPSTSLYYRCGRGSARLHPYDLDPAPRRRRLQPEVAHDKVKLLARIASRPEPQRAADRTGRKRHLATQVLGTSHQGQARL